MRPKGVRTHVRDRARIPKATKQIAFVQQSLETIAVASRYSLSFEWA
ncbi:hypothetical protein [uncultured Porphyromonas sp.]|nr:hypothetical protein [uncultured Porphyromonas sp.]